MNETHLMPDNFDATQHVSTKDCQCGPTLVNESTGLEPAPMTGDEVWQHKNLINVKPL